MKSQLAIKKIYIKTYGCQMNFSETEIISGLFLSNGFELTDNMSTADVIILNTCSIRDTAANKVIGKLGQLKRLKERNPDLILGIGGCYAQSEGDFLKTKAKYLDFIFGTYNKLKLVEIIKQIEESRLLDDYETILDVGVYPDNEQFQYKSIAYKNPVTAWVPIMRGCDNYCSYCIVPFVRGHEISRKPSDIITQVETLASKDYEEVILLGQNVNSYGKRFADGTDHKVTFAGLLKELIKIDKIKRLRFITSHPKDFPDELIDVMASSDKICKSLHLPVQSGSTNVLKAMKRQYSREYYLELVKKLRDKMPGLVLATDIIVGFPGETEEDFQLTIDLIKFVRFEQAYLFRFSSRKGTAAEVLPGQLPEAVKKQRLWALMDIQDKITEEESTKYLGTEVEVLVEGPDQKKNIDSFSGRTDSNKIVIFKGKESDIGNLVRIKITKTTPYTLFGEKL